jgi:hypothetical protein
MVNHSTSTFYCRHRNPFSHSLLQQYFHFKQKFMTPVKQKKNKKKKIKKRENKEQKKIYAEMCTVRTVNLQRK